MQQRIIESTPPYGLLINGEISGLKAGESHGFHIHADADITASCAGAGGHWNMDSKNHGSPNSADSHSGDLGNILVGANNKAKVMIDEKYAGHPSMLPGSLINPIGKAMVIHALPDDLGLGGDEGSLATGNAGARLACCVIKELDNTALPEFARCDASVVRPGSARPKCGEGLCCAAPGAWSLD